MNNKKIDTTQNIYSKVGHYSHLPWSDFIVETTRKQKKVSIFALITSMVWKEIFTENLQYKIKKFTFYKLYTIFFFTKHVKIY